MIDNVLNELVALFTKHEIMYGIGGSYMLNKCYFKTTVHDIDIFIAESDIDKVIAVMDVYDKLPTQENESIRSDYHQQYLIAGVEVDLMANMHIYHDKKLYRYALLNEEQVQHVNGHDYMYIEDWYYIYWLLERKDKLAMIKAYWIKNKNIHAERLLRLINSDEIDLFYDNNKDLFDIIK